MEIPGTHELVSDVLCCGCGSGCVKDEEAAMAVMRGSCVGEEEVGAVVVSNGRWQVLRP